MESSEKVEQLAAEWLSRRDRADWGPGDQAALDRWLDDSTANTVAYLRLCAAWDRADRLKALGAGFSPGRVPTPEQFNLSHIVRDAGATERTVRPSRRRGDFSARGLRPWWGGVLMAGSLAVAVTLPVWWLHPAAPGYETPIGGLAAVPMTDGSRVTLNTDSAIRIELTDKTRQIQLDRGEAFFEVAKDSSRPFIVNAGTRRVVAVGTKFAVRRNGDDVQVIVTEGVVRVESATVPLHIKERAPGRAPASAAHLSEGTAGGATASEFPLPAGSVAMTRGDDLLVGAEPVPQAEQSLSWRSGYLVFHESTLADAVTEFNRYNTLRISIDDPSVASIRLSGKFRTTDADAFVRLLEGGFGIRARRLADRIALVSPGAHM